MADVHKNAQKPGGGVFDSAIIRLVLLVGAIRSTQLGWIALITRALDTEVRGLFSLPALALLPWLLPAIVSAFLVYWFGVRLMERREVRELTLADAACYLPLGIFGGFILFAAVICVLWAQGWAIYEGYAGWKGIWTVALIFAAGVTFEELIYRGAIFRIVEESLGTTAALALSALLFGLSHLGNNAATLASALSIAVSGGITFGLTYTLTRSLWLPFGVHFGWNFTQGGLVGAAVSGYQLRGAFRFSFSGPALVTGGAFGPEASIYTTMFGIVFALAMGELAVRRGLWTPLRFRLRVN
jgi:membrane protease YdiL (CAAX protease family)